MKTFNQKYFTFDKTGKSLAIFPKEKYFTLSKKKIKQLKLLSKLNQNENVRICLHRTKKDALHNMIIYLNKKNFSEIHKHNSTDEIYQIISGKLKIKIFKKNKSLLKTIELSKDKNPIFRMKKNVLHQTVPVTDYVIFHECRLSPYR